MSEVARVKNVHRLRGQICALTQSGYILPFMTKLSGFRLANGADVILRPPMAESSVAPGRADVLLVRIRGEVYQCRALKARTVQRGCEEEGGEESHGVGDAGFVAENRGTFVSHLMPNNLPTQATEEKLRWAYPKFQ